MGKVKTIASLFWEFFKFGMFTFGGGWGIVAQMRKLYVEDRKTLTDTELIDMTSVARSLPGTMIGNIAMMYGYHMAGYIGGVVCVIGMIIPPMALLSVITYFYTVFQTNPWVIAAMTGVRAAVVPIIGVAVLGMVKTAFRLPPCILVAVLAVVMYLFFNVNCVYLILMGAVCGLIISEIYERRDRKEKK